MNVLPQRLVLGPALCLLLGLYVPLAAQIVEVERSTAYAMSGTELEAAVALQLCGHPATARQDIRIRLRGDRVQLLGTVTKRRALETAERLTAAVAGELRIDNRLRLVPRRESSRPSRDVRGRTRDEVARRFDENLRERFPPAVTEDLTIEVYPVRLDGDDAPAPPAARRAPPAELWIVVLEGTVPDAASQVSLSRYLVTGRPTAAAVINRTYSLASSRAERQLRIRAPFFRLNLGVGDRGVDLALGTLGGPLRVRTGRQRDRRDDDRVAERFAEALEGDPVLREVAVDYRVSGRAITLEGALRAADRMHAIRLALQTRGAVAMVDRSNLAEGGPAYHDPDDVQTYLAYRLGEHAAAMDVSLDRRAGRELEADLTVLTPFHAALAESVSAHDPVIAGLPLNLRFHEWAPGDEDRD